MSRTLTDHESIKRWAEEHGATPACVIGAGGGSDAGIRFDFEGYTGEETLARISWADWFRKFDESNLALVVDDRGAASDVDKLFYGDDDRDHQARGREDVYHQPDATDEEEFDEDDDMDGEGEYDDDEEPNR